jgi:hypothetical protein
MHVVADRLVTRVEIRLRHMQGQTAQANTMTPTIPT